MEVRSRVTDLLRASLVEKVPRDHTEPDSAFHRRRVTVVVTLAIGATLLGLSLSEAPGNSTFYLLTAALAAVWLAGGFLSGPLHLGQIPFRGTLRRPVVTPVALGLAAGAVFSVGALVVREIPPLRDYTESVLAHARQGSITLILLVTLVNGAAEEVFFRGALFAAIGRRNPVLISTVIYGVTTVTTGNPMLVFAAFTLGAVLGLQRRASGGLLAPVLTHLTWSAAMLLILPAIFPS